MRSHTTLSVAIVLGAIALMACATGYGQVNLAVNGGFEDPPDTTMNVDNTVTDWNLLLDTSRAQFYNHTSPALPTTAGGSWSLWLKTFEKAGGGATQTVPVVVPGHSYTLTAQMLFEGSVPNITGLDMFLSIQYQDALANNVGAADVTHINNTTVTTSANGNNTWTPYSVSGTVPAGATQALVEIGWLGGGTVPGQQSAFADDVTFTAGVPEPASLGLIGLGSLALLIRRRHGSVA